MKKIVKQRPSKTTNKEILDPKKSVALCLKSQKTSVDSKFFPLEHPRKVRYVPSAGWSAGRSWRGWNELWASCSSSPQKGPLPSPLLSLGWSALQLSAFLSWQLSHRTHNNLMVLWLQLHVPHSPALSRLLSASGIISQCGQCAYWWPQSSQHRAHGSAEATSPQRCQAEAAPLSQSHCYTGGQTYHSQALLHSK